MRRIRFSGILLMGAVVAAAWVATAACALGQVNYTGGAYTQDFDGLPLNENSDPLFGTDVVQVVEGKGPHSFAVLDGADGNLLATGMDGWFFGNPNGSSANTEFRAHDGNRFSSGGRGAISFGTDNSTDRALGTLPTSNQISRFGVLFTNGSGQTFTSFTVSFRGEQWRVGDRLDTNTLSFDYGVATSIDDESLANWSALNFISPNIADSLFNTGIDGNATGNFTPLSDTVTGLNWQPGQTLALRWTTDEASGQDHGIGIDDFQFAAHAGSACGEGDFNCDGKVDAADYVSWRNGDALPADYQLWRSKYGATYNGSGSSGAPVPEPAAGFLLFTAFAIGTAATSRLRLSFTEA